MGIISLYSSEYFSFEKFGAREGEKSFVDIAALALDSYHIPWGIRSSEARQRKCWDDELSPGAKFERYPY